MSTSSRERIGIACDTLDMGTDRSRGCGCVICASVAFVWRGGVTGAASRLFTAPVGSSARASSATRASAAARSAGASTAVASTAGSFTTVASAADASTVALPPSPPCTRVFNTGAHTIASTAAASATRSALG